MIVDRPRVVFSALRGNSGKTFLTVGTGACLTPRGKAVSPFKKGPDYIDAAWLEMATGHPCYNLDLFLMGTEGILSSFSTRVRHTDGALVEGNRGLYDGMDREGSYSTAELAKLLQAPVIIGRGLQHGDTYRSRHDSRLSAFRSPSCDQRGYPKSDRRDASRSHCPFRHRGPLWSARFRGCSQDTGSNLSGEAYGSRPPAGTPGGRPGGRRGCPHR